MATTREPAWATIREQAAVQAAVYVVRAGARVGVYEDLDAACVAARWLATMDITYDVTEEWYTEEQLDSTEFTVGLPEVLRGSDWW